MAYAGLGHPTIGQDGEIAARGRRLVSRRHFLAASTLAACGLGTQSQRLFAADEDPALAKKALIAITLDLEMSRQYPTRDNFEWDFQKGNLDEATKQYALEAAKRVKAKGGLIHFFCVGRVLEQPRVDWLEQIHAAGHPVGNHTYDHVNVLATQADQIQFRFNRSPWLIADRPPAEIIAENIRVTSLALKQRVKFEPDGFRTPGGFSDGLTGREDVQRMLLDSGFKWVSSKYPAHPNSQEGQEPSGEVYEGIVKAQSAAQPFVYPSGLVEVPMSPISDVGAFRTARWKLDWFLKAVRLGVEWAIQNRATFDFLAHPSCLVVEDPDFKSVEMICDLVREAGERAAIVDLGRLARRAAT